MIERTFYLDLQDSDIYKSNISINQGNADSVYFKFRIYDGLKELDYQRFTSCRVTFSIKNKAVANCECEIKMDGIACALPTEALGRHGVVSGQLDLGMITGGNLTTNYFIFTVTPSLAVLSEADKRVFVNEINELITVLESSITGSRNGYAEIEEIIGDMREKSAEISRILDNSEIYSEEIKDAVLEVEALAASVRTIQTDTKSAGDKITEAMNAAETNINELYTMLREVEEHNTQLAGLVVSAEAQESKLVKLHNDMENLFDELHNENYVTQSQLTQSVNEAVLSVMQDVSGVERFQFNMSRYSSNWSILGDPFVQVGTCSPVCFDDKAYVFGCNLGSDYTKVMIYHMNDNKWEIGIPSPYGASQSSATRWGKKLYVCGGTLKKDVVQIFDTESQTWSVSSVVPSSPSMAMNDSTGVAYNGKLYIAGGEVFQTNIRIYDISTDEWSYTSASSLIMPRLSQGAVEYDGKIYVFGCDTAATKTQIYDIENDSWSIGADCPVPISLRAVALMDSGKVFVHAAGISPYRLNLVYDTKTDTWNQEATSPFGNNRTHAVYYDNKVFVFGSTGAPVNMVMVYEKFPDTVQLVECSAGDIVQFDHDLVTDYGQRLKRFTENVVQNDGFILYETKLPTSVISGWRRSSVKY